MYTNNVLVGLVTNSPVILWFDLKQIATQTLSTVSNNILKVLRNPLGGKCENSEIKKNTINISFSKK